MSVKPLVTAYFASGLGQRWLRQWYFESLAAPSRCFKQCQLVISNINLNFTIIFFIQRLFFLEINGLNCAFCVNSQERSLNEPDKHFYQDLCDNDQHTERRINVRKYVKYIWHYWNISLTSLQCQIYKGYIQHRVTAIRLKKRIW